MTTFLILNLLQLAVLILSDRSPGVVTTPDGEVCYHVPISKSAEGAHTAASSSLPSSSPLGRVDYSLFPPGINHDL